MEGTTPNLPRVHAAPPVPALNADPASRPSQRDPLPTSFLPPSSQPALNGSAAAAHHNF
ncbi:hypothetical protein CALVIDRAFT_537406 [Calocera viscosa TUFC12733]|uniref:Uncharacterized protein n=1 Tax=Calocera viscosa (strain TUFC12733) TaxID=1330018 RepID=A0A167M0H5_CALVF|nr:hypothetical protein CALVIDRAFT_537406 [Calocera viscosa TUFC12733]